MKKLLTVVLYPPDFIHLGIDIDEFKARIINLYEADFSVEFRMETEPDDASGLGGVLSVGSALTEGELGDITHRLRVLFDSMRMR